MASLDPSTLTVNDFKSYFKRDFVYSGDACPAGAGETITDDDIVKAMAEAEAIFNTDIFPTDGMLRMAFLCLSAHYLCFDVQTAMQGPQSASSFPVGSRSVGGVSESYQVPAWVSTDPLFSSLATTRYGLKYISLIKPLLIGCMSVQEGATTSE